MSSFYIKIWRFALIRPEIHTITGWWTLIDIGKFRLAYSMPNAYGWIGPVVRVQRWWRKVRGA